MQLAYRNPDNKGFFNEYEYFCELTEELDKFLIGYSELYRTYIVDSRDKFDPDIISLRVPGSTIGYIEVEVVDDKLIIRDIVIAQYALRRFNKFNKGLNKEILKKFIGQSIEFPAEEVNADELQS